MSIRAVIFPRVGRWWLAVLAAVAVPVAPAAADEQFLSVRVGDLEIIEGSFADPPPADPEAAPGGARSRWNIRESQPFVVLDGPGEAFVDRDGAVDQGSEWLVGVDPQNWSLSVRLPEPRAEVTGRLVRPRSDGLEGTALVRFRLDPAKSRPEARTAFLWAKVHHYRRLLDRGLPGGAWFRHQMRTAQGELHVDATRERGGPIQGSDLDRTLAFFGGGRAIRENLQLDRELNPTNAPIVPPEQDKPVPVDSIAGITVAEIDWSARIAGKSPDLDPLAAAIPADQHALFFPSLEAVGALVETFQRHGAPPALVLLPRGAADAGVLARYEKQLGIGLGDLGEIAKLGVVRSVALTGSDPYFADGTDVAILFETTDPAPLMNGLAERLRAGGGGLTAFIGAGGTTVVLSNSAVQRDRVLETIRGGGAGSLAKLPEYVFFRDRYRRGDAGETALLVLSDATIRRWCGPRWRIAASRRARAGAWLAEIQAAHAEAIVAGRDPGPIGAPAGSMALGDLKATPDGIASSIYGTAAFQTPIVEIPLEEVEAVEARLYETWRDNYQRNWRGVFDPIALRLAAAPDRIEADLTVMPLIVASDYRPFVDLVGNARIPERGGDPHPEALLQLVLALDLKAKLFQEGGESVARMLEVPPAVALGWLGSAVSVALDDDPFWAEMAEAEEPWSFVSTNLNRLPVAVFAEVKDPARLALFLGAARAYLDRSMPDGLEWSNRKHGERSYVRVAAKGDAGPPGGLQIFYAATPKGLLVSPSEAVVTRFLDRVAAGADRPEASPWLGSALAGRVDARGLRVLGRTGRLTFRQQMQARSWDNLPILDEWRRLFPDRDPVEVHRALWGETLACPGGGSYAVDEATGLMASTAYGNPVAPKDGPGEVPHPLAGVGGIAAGVGFEDGGLRGRLRVDWADDAPPAAR